MAELLEMREISKIYGNGVYANQRISFSIKKGEIHALVGENGAGKSTLMKILFGLEKPDHGELILEGETQNFQSPQDAMAKGIGMVHQHFMLVESFSVRENIALGYEPIKNGFVDKKEANKRVLALSEKFNMKINPDSVVRDLPVGLKQKVEILKALYRGAKILILDEPTAVLTPQETTELFAQLKHLKEQGFTVIFITHKLREVKEISDRISVMRSGKMITTVDTADVTEAEISALMMGTQYSSVLEKKPAKPTDCILQVDNVKHVDSDKKAVVDGISFTVRAGEIMGIAGVEGNGQNELIELITNLEKLDSGKITMFGKDTKGKHIRKLREAGLAYIPSDRMTLGITKQLSIEDNLITTKLKSPEIYNKFKLLDPKAIRKLSQRLVKEYLIKCKSPLTEVDMLSGGNMQKVVVAREFTQENVKLIIAEQPTRGIDVGAAKFIHEKLVELRDAGCAVLLISADLEELYKLSDSMLVIYDGKLSAYFEDPSKISEQELGKYMLGVETQSDEEIRRAYHA
nr:ABC transporter ATP-binding protein [uncultured Aminipila sp.]